MAQVLVVEDHAALRDTLTQVLEDAGYTVTAVAQGAAALAAMRQAPPDAVLLDLGLPVLDGWGVLRAQAGEAALRAIPVIVTSGVWDVAAPAAAGLRLDAVLPKPFDLGQLLALVARATERCAVPPARCSAG